MLRSKFCVLFPAAGLLLLVSAASAQIIADTPAPVITSISPSSGPVGTQVAITGTGFSPDGNTINFGSGVVPNLNSDGRTISFSVPSALAPACYYARPQCLIAAVITPAGDYKVSVTNSYGKTSGGATFSVTDASSLAITTASPLPSGQVYGSYSAQISATGGTGSYSWRISSGSLPPGLSLNPAVCIAAPCRIPVTISGTPISAGTFTFTIELSSGPLAGDGPTYVVSKEFSLTVAAATSPLTITTSSPLPNGQVNSSYSVQVSATGGTGSYSWRISSGSLPPGLSLNPAVCIAAPCRIPVTISGTPISAGTFTFTIELSSGPLAGDGPTLDGPTYVASKQFSLTINSDSSPTITTSSPLPSGQAGSAYSATISATGGSSSYSWRISSGSLPPGLSLFSPVCFMSPCQAPATISGTPTSAGDYVFTVALGSWASKQFNLTVRSSGSTTSGGPMQIDSISPSSGPVGTIVTLKGSNFPTSGNTVHFDITSIENVSSNGSTMSFLLPSYSNPACRYANPPCALAQAQIVPGNYGVWVTGPNGKSNALTFSVTDSKNSGSCPSRLAPPANCYWSADVYPACGASLNCAVPVQIRPSAVSSTIQTPPSLLGRFNASNWKNYSNHVLSLQRFLLLKKYLASISDPGVLDEATQSALMKYQCDKGIVCSGSERDTGYGAVGPRTQAAINSEIKNPGGASSSSAAPAVSAPVSADKTAEIKQRLQSLQDQLDALLKLLKSGGN